MFGATRAVAAHDAVQYIFGDGCESDLHISGQLCECLKEFRLETREASGNANVVKGTMGLSSNTRPEAAATAIFRPLLFQPYPTCYLVRSYTDSDASCIRVTRWEELWKRRMLNGHICYTMKKLNKPFLSRSVPYLQLAALFVDFDDADFEINSGDRSDVGAVSVCREAEQQAALAHTGVSC
jgi:hypothetical protein